MEFIDTHCHLHFSNYDADRQQVLDDSIAAGVKEIICVGVDLVDSQRAIDYAKDHNHVWATAGVHPHEAADVLKKSGAKALSELLDQPKVVAIGEIGLDFYKLRSGKQEQQKALHQQIELGLHKKLPFVFHVRDGWPEFWQIYDSFPALPGVLHSFSAGPQQLKAALSRGLYIALNGIMTFTKDEAQLIAAKQIPLDRLMLETDAPFLAPKEFRGQRAEPKHVISTAKFLAELRGESLEAIAKATTKNARQLFGLKP